MTNWQSNNTIGRIKLFNVLGDEVLSKEVNAPNFNLDISMLTPGSYVAKLDCNGQSKTIKLLKL